MSFITQVPFTPHPYAEMREGVVPTIIAPETYESWVRKFERTEGVEALRVTYDSEGLAVTGIILQPVGASAQQCPLIVFNRGGRDRYGMVNVLTLNNLLIPLVQRGYIVAASQYRGVDGSEGTDEFGGGEVADIVHLLEAAKSLPAWDGKNSHFFGWSRGGMMSLMALKQGARVNAVALGAPLIDLTLSTDDGGKKEAWLHRVLPDYAEQGFEALEARSAPYWLDKIGEAPLLLMHGDADADVSIAHSRQLAQKLRARNHHVELIEYEGGNHYLNRQRAEVLQEVDQWFQKYHQI